MSLHSAKNAFTVILNGSRVGIPVLKRKINRILPDCQIMTHVNGETLTELKQRSNVKSYYLYDPKDFTLLQTKDIEFPPIRLYDDFININTFQ